MLKIGHRGASGAAPENTLAAFVRALELGADGVELDVHLLKSGELAVIHDETVNRTTDGKGRVADMTLDEFRSLRTKGEVKHALSTLDEVLGVLQGTHCFIEIKHEEAALPAMEDIRSAIRHGYPADHLWLISFHHKALERALAEFPVLNVGASFEKLDFNSLRDARALGARAIIPHHRSFDASRLGEAHDLGLKVISWTVNESADIARLKAMGVDGIMSDYPERLLADG